MTYSVTGFRSYPDTALYIVIKEFRITKVYNNQFLIVQW